MDRIVPVAAAVAVTLLMAFDAGRTLELPVRDYAVRRLPTLPADTTVVVAVDESSLRSVGPWPWRREILAEIVDRIAAAGGRAAIFDVLLADARPGDDVLARSMQRIPSIGVAVLVEGEQWLVPAPALRSACVVAHGNFELDHDGILRRFASTKQNREVSYTALSLVAASLVGATPVPVGHSVAPSFRTPPRSIPRIGAADLLAGRIDPARVRGKLVFVGPTALGLGDRVLTPVSTALAPDPGVTVHASATESLVRGERIHEAPPLVSGLLAGALVAILLRTEPRSRSSRWIVAGSLATVVTGGGFALLAATGRALPFVILLFTIVVTAIAVESSVMRASLRQSSVKLEEIATRLAEQRAHDIESKRILAHELKTPLASMRNLTQLLDGFELSPNERKRVTTLLQQEAGKLQSMVDALLDLERLPLRDFQASSRVTDLGELVSARVEVVRASAARPVAMSIRRGTMVRADPILIERVVDNLLGNAIKYTPAPAPIRVAVDESADTAVLEVADRGPGIPDAERDRVFQRFFRGTTAAGTEGLGLGLSLVSEVAKWHGGRVTVGRAEEGGALFRFELPVAVEAAAVSSTESGVGRTEGGM